MAQASAALTRHKWGAIEQGMPAASSLEETRARASSQLKLMTEEQYAQFDALHRMRLPWREVLGARAGTGKTFVAIKLIADDVRSQKGGDSPAALLLVHTQLLLHEASAELRRPP